MTEAEISHVLLVLGIVIVLAHLLGHIFSLMRQPRLVGEILAGVLIGPYVLGKLSPQLFESLFAVNEQGDQAAKVALGFVYWLGILLLMFLSGSQVRELLSKENRRPTFFLLGIGKTLPFAIVLLLGMYTLIPLHALTNSEAMEFPALLIVACAVAVTSIPVLSRIFQDLNIMETRFASLILGAAVLEDIVLWGIVAVATSYASTNHDPTATIVLHIVLSLGFLFTGLTILPKLLADLRRWKRNLLYRTSPIAFAMVVLSAYVGLAGIMEVNLVFAAFLAGFGLVGGATGSERRYFKDTLEVISKFSFAVLIPVYFVMVGYRLVFNEEFSIPMLLIFFVGSSLIAVASISLAAWLAGYRKHDIANLAITLNARGGPGIVLATIAYEAHIINAAFYTTLVLTALLTSQLAGGWLSYVLRKKLPLLSK